MTKGKWISCIFYLFKFQSAVSGKNVFVLHRILSLFQQEWIKGNQRNASWLFFKGNRQESGVKCFCPEFHLDDNWSCFLEFTGSNYDQICFCGIHIPPRFCTTHPPIQLSIFMADIFLFPGITTQNNNRLRNIKTVKAVFLKTGSSIILFHYGIASIFLMLSSWESIFVNTEPKIMDLSFVMWDLILWPQLPKQTLSNNPVGLLDRNGGNKELSLQLKDLFLLPHGS